MARDLLLFDPPRVLAWRFLHDPRIAGVPAWLAPFVPRPSGAWDRDPLALLLGAVAFGLATAYLLAGLLGCGPRVRAALLAKATLVLVVLPTVAFVAMGAVTGRPYGQDGGVVQLPLAMDKILAGQSPYGADYSDSILGKEARVSDFWTPYGGNPILHHHAYLPGTHLLMAPFYFVSRVLFGFFDPRVVTLLAYLAAILLAARLPGDPAKRLAAAALVAVNPLVYWHQIFGANDILLAALLLGVVHLERRGRTGLAAATLGLACATKQLAWPFAPFLLAHLTGLRDLRDLPAPPVRARLLRTAAIVVAVFLVVVAPVAALDLEAFWGDIVVYNVGLPGANNYPLGGTPGFGFANVLIDSGVVGSLRDYFPFGWFYVLLAPLGLLLLRRQLQENGAPAALLAGGIALLASLYFSRVVHPNYLILAAILIPVGVLMSSRPRTDAAVIPLLLFAVAVEIVEQAVFRTTWEDTAGFTSRVVLGPFTALAPRASPALTNDPIGLALGAVAAGLGLVYLTATFLGVSSKVRTALIAGGFVVLVLLPTALVIRIGSLTGKPRVQAAWMAAALAGRETRDSSPTGAVPMEAWSQSFRRDPPGPVVPGAVGETLGARAVKGIPLDPRWLCLVALAAASFPFSRHVAGEPRLVLWGVALLSAPAVIGVPFGSPDPLALLAIASALLLPARTFLRGFVAGVGGGATSRLAWSIPVALTGAGGRCTGRDRALAVLGLATGFVLVAIPSLLQPSPAASAEGAEPGVGWTNVLGYWGAEDAAWWTAVIMGVGSAVALWRWAVSLRASGSLLLTTETFPAWLGTALLLEMFFRPLSSPHELLVPLVLIAVSAIAGVKAP